MFWIPAFAGMTAILKNMFEKIHQLLKRQRVLFHLNQSVTIASVVNSHEGFNLAKTILYEIVDFKTALYLSGGSTPKTLYEKLAHEELLTAGAIGIVDERYGAPFHDKSNEKMIRETGFLRYVQMKDIPFYPILSQRHRDPDSIGSGDLHGTLSDPHDGGQENRIQPLALAPRGSEDVLRTFPGGWPCRL